MNKNKLHKLISVLINKYKLNVENYDNKPDKKELRAYFTGGVDALYELNHDLISKGISDIENEVPVSLMRTDLKPSQFYLFDYFLAIDKSLNGVIKKRYNSIEEVEKDKNFYYDELFGVIREKEHVILIKIEISREED